LLKKQFVRLKQKTAKSWGVAGIANSVNSKFFQKTFWGCVSEMHKDALQTIPPTTTGA
jgi:hypothetical protein